MGHLIASFYGVCKLFQNLFKGVLAMVKLELVSVDVHMALGGEDDKFASVVSATPQEAFAMITMPALAGSIIKLVPNYELPKVSQE